MNIETLAERIILLREEAFKQSRTLPEKIKKRTFVSNQLRANQVDDAPRTERMASHSFEMMELQRWLDKFDNEVWRELADMKEALWPFEISIIQLLQNEIQEFERSWSNREDINKPLQVPLERINHIAKMLQLQREESHILESLIFRLTSGQEKNFYLTQGPVQINAGNYSSHTFLSGNNAEAVFEIEARIISDFKKRIDTRISYLYSEISPEEKIDQIFDLLPHMFRLTVFLCIIEAAKEEMKEK